MTEVLFTAVSDKCTPKPSGKFPFAFDIIYCGNTEMVLPQNDVTSYVAWGESKFINNYTTASIPTGVEIRLPENVCASLSLSEDIRVYNHKMQDGKSMVKIPKNKVIIQAGFQGSLLVPIINTYDYNLQLQPYSALAQLRLHYLPCTLHKIDKLPPIFNFNI